MEWEIDLGNGKTKRYDGKGDLKITNCTTITHLPDGLKVGAWLTLRGCISLSSLPDGLEVNGWLDLENCISLAHLPDRLKVSRSLYLDGCTALTCLPDDLKVSEHIFSANCHRLYIPASIECKSVKINSDQYFICRNKPGKFEERPSGVDCILMKEGGD